MAQAGPLPRGDMIAALGAFDTPMVVDGVIETLSGRGWIEEFDGRLRLAPDGGREQYSLAPLVEQVRQQVAAARPPEDYASLIRLLARLIAAFPEFSG